MTSPTQDVCLRTLGMTVFKMKVHASSLCGKTYLFLKKQSFLTVSLSCLVDIALVRSLYYEKQSYYRKFN